MTTTQRQVIISYLTEFGAQKLDAIIWECKVQATRPIADSAIKEMVGSLLESGEVFTDGVVYASHPAEIATDSLQHFSVFLAKSIEDLLKEIDSQSK